MADQVLAGLCSSFCSLQDPSEQRQIHQDCDGGGGGGGASVFLSHCSLQAPVQR